MAEVHDRLRIDDYWLTETEDGFTWWPGELAQTIWTEPGVFRGGQVTYRVHAEMDLLKGRAHFQQLEYVLEHEMDGCTFSAPVFDYVPNVFKLHSSAFINDERATWLRRIFCDAALLQVIEADDISHRIAKTFKVELASGSHPQAGVRPRMTTELERIAQFFMNEGHLPSQWVDVDEWRQTGWSIEREAMKFESDKASRLTAYFPWDPSPAEAIRLEITTEEPHPRLGNGLHFTLRVPLHISDEHVSHLALEMNNVERTEWQRTHVLGSWCSHDKQLAFRLFVPNRLYSSEVLPEFAVAMCSRAIWANEFFVAKKADAMRRSGPSVQ